MRRRQILLALAIFASAASIGHRATHAHRPPAAPVTKVERAAEARLCRDGASQSCDARGNVPPGKAPPRVAEAEYRFADHYCRAQYNNPVDRNACMMRATGAPLEPPDDDADEDPE